ncbi:imidazole glycerol phosphate synthase subunit HisF [Ornithinibacillus scapharcae]|uniref:imidazole glycerol phosphate synthase subunit HisF n=1 Tax=Ornithinibacillus scapharcae TaxID=1147159 RepID=UPI000225BF41|nr:imidazole glycerol phosphate synthase subunit HisF [Ornithinibacillus scapharcae]
MLAKRIIPCLDVDKGRVVKGKKFQDIQDIADPVELALRYNHEGADELVFYDITASHEERKTFLDIVEKVAATINIPFTVGGGIRSVEDIYQALQSGADKVSINSAAITNPTLIETAASKFGSQCIVLSIDAKEINTGKWNVFQNGGRIDTGLDAIEWALEGERLGAGELVINSIDVDGVKKGYNLQLTKTIANAVYIPIVASGGAGIMEDFYQVLHSDIADAALAASVFHYNTISIPALKNYLVEKSVPVRSVPSCQLY